MSKIQLGVIFGSRTCEHEVAIISAVQLMRNVNREKYDVIFLDPPYDSGLVSEALRSLYKNGLAAAGAAIVCETDNGTDARPSRRHVDPAETEAKEAAAVTEQVFGGDESLAEAYTVEKTVSYGRTRITVLRPAKEEA